MKIVYIADDGTQFDDEWDCKDYEWRLNHPHLKDVHIFDKDGNRLEDVLSEDTYNLAEIVVITSDEAVKDLQDLADYTGYCDYEYIDKIGKWRFVKEEEKFVMI